MILMPGEDAAAYDELHAQLVAELRPCGVLEEDFVSAYEQPVRIASAFAVPRLMTSSKLGRLYDGHL